MCRLVGHAVRIPKTYSERCNFPYTRRDAAAEVVVRMQTMHPERFAHAAHFRVQKIHPEGCVPVERARCLVAIAPALHGRSTNMRSSKSSHPQCPSRLHRPPHTQNPGIHLAIPWVFALLLATPKRCLRVCSTRSLCAPQRAHNAVSFCQCALPCDRLAGRFGGRAIPPQLQRVLALSPASVGHLPSALLRTTCALSACNRCSRSFPPSSPLGEPGEESLRPTLLPADSCRTAGIEEMGLHRSRQSVVACNRRPRVETAASLITICPDRGTAASSEHRGRQVIKLTTDSGSVWMQASRRSGRRVQCTDSATTSYEMAPFLMPLDRDTARSPRTRVLAGIARR